MKERDEKVKCPESSSKIPPKYEFDYEEERRNGKPIRKAFKQCTINNCAQRFYKEATF
jgi:hypothetical protein